MSNQTSAAETIQNLAIVLAEQYKAGLLESPGSAVVTVNIARTITREVCRKTYKQHHNQLETFDVAWARFQGRIRKP